MSFYMAAGDTYGDASTVSELLRQSGVSPNLAVLATPMMFWTPSESDPSSAMTLIIVQGAQRRLKKLGFAVRTHGRMDPATQGALAKIVGPGWASRAWVQIYGDLGSERESMGDMWDDLKALLPATTPAPSISPVGPSVTGPVTSAPSEAARYGTIPYEEMRGGTRTQPYYTGETARAHNAFLALQAAVGSKTDGKIGEGTFKATIAIIDPMWRARFTLNMQPSEADLLAKVLASTRPAAFRVAAYADVLAKTIVRYRPGAKPKPKPKPVRPEEPTIVDTGPPPPPLTTGVMDLKVAGIPVVPALAVAGVLWFATRTGGKKRPGRRRKTSRGRR